MVPLLVVLSLLAPEQPLAHQELITTATGVRVRLQPSTTSAIVALLPIGTELTVIETSQVEGWRTVLTPGGEPGWIAAAFVRPFEPQRRAEMVESIVESRIPDVERRGTPGTTLSSSFADRVQVAALIERARDAESDAERRARLDWLLLRALDHAAVAIKGPWPAGPPPMWIGARPDRFSYDAPGGGWKVDYNHIRRVHERARGTAAADDIAWLMVVNGLAGECEGDLSCYLEAMDLRYGQYLRWHPTGRYAFRAVDDLTASLQSILEDLERQLIVLAGSPDRDLCGELRDPLASLRATAETSSAAGIDAVAGVLDRYVALCPASTTQ